MTLSHGFVLGCIPNNSVTVGSLSRRLVSAGLLKQCMTASMTAREAPLVKLFLDKAFMQVESPPLTPPLGITAKNLGPLVPEEGKNSKMRHVFRLGPRSHDGLCQVHWSAGTGAASVYAEGDFDT